ncbi:MAG: sigma factor-like helix-turn-helix DNA-binding protein [Burkholderia sp.]
MADTQRISMVLVAIEGFSYEEVAQILGISAGNVASNVVQARMMIGARLRKGGQPVSRLSSARLAAHCAGFAAAPEAPPAGSAALGSYKA